jgi:cell division septation protein DedD
MNPYRSRSPHSAINRIAVALVVLIALGAILASILLGPKPNATIVMMQPIRPLETSNELPNILATPSSDAPTNAAPPSDTVPSGDTAPSSDPLASVPTDQLPVIQSQPAQAITSEPANIEQSELGVEVPPVTSSAMTDDSSPTASNISTSTATSSQPDATAQSAPTTTVQSVTPPIQTNSSQTNSIQASDTQPKPATVTARSNTPRPVSSSAVRPVQTIKPDSAASSAATSSMRSTATSSVRSTATSSVRSTTTSSVKPTTVASAQNPSSSTTSAIPRRAFLRRATNGVSVQVVALSNLNAAAKLAQNLAANGFTANVQPSGSIYRVVIGPYASETAAQTAATRATGFFR